MDNKWKFWSVVKKKIWKILMITIVITFFIVKAVDLYLNWYLNRQTLAYGVRYNYTISIFSPIIAVIVFVLVTNIMKAFLNRRIEKQKIEGSKRHWDYTWKDIFKDRESFMFYLLAVLGSYCLWYSIIQKISSLSSNYAVSSIANISTGTVVLVSCITAAILFVILQNTIIAWLIQTEKGHKTLCILTQVFGIVTFAVMIGVSYLWSGAEESIEDFAADAAIGLIIPFDINTVFFGMVTLWLWKKAKAYTAYEEHRARANAGLILAIVSVIISFTPLPMAVQMFIISFKNSGVF